MKLIIDAPDEVVEKGFEGPLTDEERQTLIRAIGNGIPYEERPRTEWVLKEDVIHLLKKWADGYSYIELPTEDAIKAIKDMEDGAEPPKCEMIQDLIDKTTVNAGAARPIRKGAELISTGYNSHDCESFYRCPFCGYEYSSWGLFHKGIKTESDFECFQCGKLLYFR